MQLLLEAANNFVILPMQQIFSTAVSLSSAARICSQRINV